MENNGAINIAFDEVNTFSLTAIGFSQIEKGLIRSMCNLSIARTAQSTSAACAGYKFVDPPNAANAISADIVIVDVENRDALDAWRDRSDQEPPLPAILVSKQEVEPNRSAEYTLKRSRLGGLLLRLLDEIAKTHLLGNAASTKAVEPRIRKRSLVVDDSQPMRTQMRIILKQYDLDVEIAKDAESALRILQNTSFDIIFLDVILPEMDGYKACKLIKANKNTRDTPVVILTSKRSPFDRMHGALVGCDKYLTKPVDPNRVQKVLQQYGCDVQLPQTPQTEMATA